MDVDIVAIITALGAGGIIKTIVDYIIQRKKDLDAKRASDELANMSFSIVFEAVHTVYYVLLAMLRNCPARRITLLKTTNGGGRPTLTGRLFSSVIYEAFEYPLFSVKESWQKQLLDVSYVEMLFEMNKTGKLSILTANLPPSILKSLYSSNGIVQSWVYRIHERENEYIYLSINFTEKALDDPETDEVFRVGVSKLKTLFSTNPKI